MKQIFAVTRKELYAYFSSPMALIFIGVFVAATLFTFFWLDTFFARGLADVRPLFRWMPLLLIFLIAALTMRQWSAEDQSGALEILLTLPVAHWQLVLGKFLGAMTLVVIALGLTLSLPITVSLLGNLDWGPVLGGYLAALLLSAAFVAIGLFISSRTRNEIVALILTSVIGLVLYLIGTPGITEFFGDQAGQVLRTLSTNSRFESIQRGVVDLRDLVYYATLCTLFLALNALSLDTKRWSATALTGRYRRFALLATGLVALNLIALNIWIAPISGARLDLTQQREYTLSQPTRDLIANLQEPLLIRGHFSSRTHPLLAPLTPRIVDTLREYEVASQGMIRVEIVDPAQNPEIEAEAAQTYGIRPTPFQIADRHEAAVVNAYFDILVRYGDQSEVLNFQDLIEIEAFRDGQLDVRLRNLEYDLTRSIQRTVYGFQSLDSILASLNRPAEIILFATPATLPPELLETAEIVRSVGQELAAGAPGNLTFTYIEPDDPNSPVNRQTLIERYGLQPFMASFFSEESFYLHLLMQLEPQTEGELLPLDEGETPPQVLYPTADLTAGEVRTVIETGLKRFSSGFLQVVGLWQPAIGPDPMMAQFGQNQPPPFSTWEALYQILQEDYEVRRIDLATGRVDNDIDVLIVVAPQNMGVAERFAVDQFLMRGGSVIVAASNFQPVADPFTGELTLSPTEAGLNDLLAHYGITVEPVLVLDPQNEPFPISVNRDVGGFSVQEIQSLDYPYFVDIRSDGMDAESPILANLPALTLNWVSPVYADPERTGEREVVTLARSTSNAWVSTSLTIQPDTQQYPQYGFPVTGEQAAYPLAVSQIGAFESYFAGGPNPLADLDSMAVSEAAAISPLIERSPENARLVVIGSAHFLNDTVFTISSQIAMDRYLNSLRLVQNAVDWSVEDLDLLSIRARGSYARLLRPLENGEENFWELINYGFALAGLLVIGLTWANFRRSEQPLRLTPRKPDSLDTGHEQNPESSQPPPDSESAPEHLLAAHWQSGDEVNDEGKDEAKHQAPDEATNQTPDQRGGA